MWLLFLVHAKSLAAAGLYKLQSLDVSPADNRIKRVAIVKSGED